MITCETYGRPQEFAELGTRFLVGWRIGDRPQEAPPIKLLPGAPRQHSTFRAFRVGWLERRSRWDTARRLVVAEVQFALVEDHGPVEHHFNGAAARQYG